MSFSKSNTLLFVFCFSFLFHSCSKTPDKILPKKNGKWDGVITNHTTSTGGYDTTAINTTVFTFLNDGTGSYIDLSAGGVSFTWSYSKDSKKITYQRTGHSALVFDVTVMEKKSERWHVIYYEIIGPETYTTDLTLDLRKAD